MKLCLVDAGSTAAAEPNVGWHGPLPSLHGVLKITVTAWSSHTADYKFICHIMLSHRNSLVQHSVWTNLLVCLENVLMKIKHIYDVQRVTVHWCKLVKPWRVANSHMLVVWVISYPKRCTASCNKYETVWKRVHLHIYKLSSCTIKADIEHIAAAEV